VSRLSVVEVRTTLTRRPSVRRKASTSAKQEAIAGYVFILPWLLGFVGLTLGPMLASLWLSFTKYNLLSPPQWIGVQNFIQLFSDARFLHSIRITLLYVGVSVPLKLGFALLLAVLLNRGLRGLTIYRALFYVPSLLGSSVAIAILWRQVFGDGGLVNAALKGIGWHTPPSWLTDPSLSIYALIALAVWEFGSPMIIFLAGLRQIPRDLYEAAQIDGAGRVRQFAKVTIPLLTPLILFNLVLQMIGAFQAFTPAFIISGGTGGPVDGTLFYTLYLYQQAFGYLQMGYGAAMAWLLFVVVALFTGAIFLTSRHWVFYLEQS
jgi:multiple sugar transport system permease protein